MKITKPIAHLMGKGFVEKPTQVLVEFDGHEFTRGELAEALAPYATPASAKVAIHLLKKTPARSFKDLERLGLNSLARVRGMGESRVWALAVLLYLVFGMGSVNAFVGKPERTWATIHRASQKARRRGKHPV